MTPTDDDWIDLCALISASFIRDGMLVIDYDWKNKHDGRTTKEVITHLLRKALRKVGHEITKVRSSFDGNHRICSTYYTTITEEECMKMRELWKDWSEEFEEIENIENDDEEASDDETASVNVDDMDDNPSN